MGAERSFLCSVLFPESVKCCILFPSKQFFLSTSPSVAAQHTSPAPPLHMAARRIVCFVSSHQTSLSFLVTLLFPRSCANLPCLSRRPSNCAFGSMRSSCLLTKTHHRRPSLCLPEMTTLPASNLPASNLPLVSTFSS